MRKKHRLIGEILDDQVYDRNGKNSGKVDGIVLVLRKGKPPRVAALESGLAVLARRLFGARAEAIVSALGKRLGIREPRVRIGWKHVAKIEPLGLHLDLDITHTGVYAWEHWLREHVMKHLPFAR
jgi:sporulation protein YlmC with PRC-barrel domain